MLIKQNNALKKLKISSSSAFTIVELLIVIVIIGILAAITIVSYTGITKKANESTIQADLANAKKQIELYKVIHGQYPTGLDSNNCLTGNINPSPDTNYCLKKSNSTATYTMSNADGSIYTLKLDTGTLAYKITESTGPISIVATPAAESFVKTWGGSGDDYARALIQTSDGGYAITGYTASYGVGGGDIFLAKYDSSGNLSWNKTWGGSGSVEGAYSLIQTSDGGFVVSGHTYSFGAGSGDALLVKYDAGGNVIWNKTWGGAGSDQGQSIVQSSDGGYVVAGYTASYGSGNNDAFIIKYDTSGSIVWNKVWGATGDDTSFCLTQINDGGYVIAGYTTSYGAGNTDMLIVKFDSLGNLVWNKTWGGGSDDRAYNITKAADGGFLVTGYSQSYGIGSTDMLLAKYDGSGNLIWNRTWGGGNEDYGWGLTQSAGNYVVSGYTASYGAGNHDAFLVKYDNSGNLIWNKTLGGASYDYAWNVIQYSDGGYAIAGQTSSFGAGASDAILTKYNLNGNITNCTSPMCQSPTATVTTPSAMITTPSATISTPSATITTPAATITTPAATQTTVVAAP